ncbi:MAG: S-adenosylmethionine:tRNA ribosyltransferase-isomerase [Bacteroidota bacterium]
MPEAAIAKYPLPDREQSRLLVYRGGHVDHMRFTDLPSVIPEKSWMVFNNTRVIQARLNFRKPTGARIEVFCLEPVDPAEYQLSFESMQSCTWKCLVGNAKKWKSGEILLDTSINGEAITLKANLLKAMSDGFLVRFSWNSPGTAFSELIESAGSTPIPPYLNRRAEASDRQRYQTIYSRDPGSVAAPTAGLHFTDRMMERLGSQGVESREITLHVGAGTFVPVKHDNARQHAMHAETVLVSRHLLEYWLTRDEQPLAVGTTSTRSLETIYWLGVKLISGVPLDTEFNEFRQWENEGLPQEIPFRESLGALIHFCRENRLEQIRFSTSLMIVPGYRFRSIGGLITNFHMPGSTLLLLIAALIGEEWQMVYREALENSYRFLSYGDSSILLPNHRVSG